MGNYRDIYGEKYRNYGKLWGKYGNIWEKISGWWCNNHLEKYEFVNVKDHFPYMKWKIKFMFETTNQYM